jgi:hypothetical protein
MEGVKSGEEGFGMKGGLKDGVENRKRRKREREEKERREEEKKRRKERGEWVYRFFIVTTSGRQLKLSRASLF